MQKPTEAELEVLAILWELKEASVRQVHDFFEKLLGGINLLATFSTKWEKVE